MSDAQVGLVVTHRRYVPYSHAHYAGNLVDGAYSLGLFGDVATAAASAPCPSLCGTEGRRASVRRWRRRRQWLREAGPRR